MTVTQKAEAPSDPVIEGSWTARRAGVAEVREHIVRALARVRWQSIAVVQRQPGDVRIDSQEAEVVISMLEIESGLELARIEDLRPDELATVRSLTRLVHGKLSAGPRSGAEGGH